MSSEKYRKDVAEAKRQEYRNYLDMLERERRLQLKVLRSLEDDLAVDHEPEEALEARPVTEKYEYGYSSKYQSTGIR